MGIVCDECENKPCPLRSWVKKNECPRIVAFNNQLGQCCATCMHCIDKIYCSLKRKKGDTSMDFYKYLIRQDIFKYGCENWTNQYDE